MNKKIIIVGAGLSGLAAYNRLLEYGFDVTILEARGRPGGRVWTDNRLGIPFGCGAGWIHGAEGNLITQLANHSHARFVSVDPSQFITFDRSGRLISQQDIQQFNIKFEIILKKAKEFAYHAKSDVPLFLALTEVIKSEQLSSLERDLFEVKLLYFEGYIGAGSEFLSARHWDDEIAWPGDNCFLTSSYQPILDELVKNCPVKMNNVVKKISIGENSIEVVTDDAVFLADAVIVTVPLGVLKKNAVIFEPPLPEGKQKAIQNLGMGVFNIAAIKFPSVFWPQDAHAMFFTQFDSLSIPIFFNLHHFTGQSILAGYSGGERARQLESFSDEKLIEKTMDNFKKVFGLALPDPESYLVTRWASDSFSWGSYSHIPVGASANDYETISQPVGKRLFFAGEATSSEYPATTHGAYLSGIREAERIKRIFMPGVGKI